MDTTKLWCPPSVDPDNWWGDLLGQLSGKLNDSMSNLIGIRGVCPWANESHGSISKVAYDDSFILLMRGKPPSLFNGSSHAYQLFSKLSPDVNGDGIGDVGTIIPGSYLLTYCGDKYPVFELTMPDGNKKIPCYRDLKHDGNPSKDHIYEATDVLAHTGFDAPPDATHRSSIACQTFSLEYLQLMEKAGHKINYYLITVEKAIELLEDTRRRYITTDERTS
jgi:hypothetical protein